MVKWAAMWNYNGMFNNQQPVGEWAENALEAKAGENEWFVEGNMYMKINKRKNDTYELVLVENE